MVRVAFAVVLFSFKKYFIILFSKSRRKQKSQEKQSKQNNKNKPVVASKQKALTLSLNYPPCAASGLSRARGLLLIESTF